MAMFLAAQGVVNGSSSRTFGFHAVIQAFI